MLSVEEKASNRLLKVKTRLVYYHFAIFSNEMTVLIAETCHHEIGGDGSESLIVRNFGFQKKMTCFSTRSVWVGFPGSHS